MNFRMIYGRMIARKTLCFSQTSSLYSTIENTLYCSSRSMRENLKMLAILKICTFVALNLVLYDALARSFFCSGVGWNRFSFHRMYTPKVCGAASTLFLCNRFQQPGKKERDTLSHMPVLLGSGYAWKTISECFVAIVLKIINIIRETLEYLCDVACCCRVCVLRSGVSYRFA